MNLPPALTPWAQHLNLFPPEYGLALGHLVQRIAAAIGPWAAAQQRHTGTPDGFDGLARHGSYERLLLSEWALADELPDEFMRRAVMGEHLFLNPAQATPNLARVSLALFDAGPNQLGTPRLAHLAVLLVLARRAAAVGANFVWGVVQGAPDKAFSEVSAATVRHLLEARSHLEAIPQHLKIWQESLSDWHKPDDAWLIGGARLKQLAAGRRFSYLEIADPLTPEVRQLELTVNNTVGYAKSLTLDLPPAQVCTQLLRDPFAASVAALQKSDAALGATANLLFDA